MLKKLTAILMVGTLLMGITACVSTAQGDSPDTAPETFSFRDTVWGMTIDEVKEIEGEPNFENFSDLLYDNSRGNNLTRLNVDISGFPEEQPTRVIYVFSAPEGGERTDLRLAYAHYQVYYEPVLTSVEKPINGIVLPSVDTVSRMVEDYNNLKDELTEKYGEPDRQDDVYWHGNRQNESQDEEALRNGDYVLSTSWTREDTVLFLQISANSLLTISIYDVTRLEGNIEIMLSSVHNPPVLNPALDFPQYINIKYRLWGNQ